MATIPESRPYEASSRFLSTCDYWALAKASLSQWSQDKAPQLGAALAFYSILSIGPLLLIAISVAGLVFGREAASGQVEAQIQGLVGTQAAQAIQTILANSGTPSSGVIATSLGLLTLLIGASGVFGQMQDSMNTIWKALPPSSSGFLTILRQRFFSFAMILSTGFLLMVSLVISALLAAVSKYFTGAFSNFAPYLEILNFVVSFGVFILLFAMMFKVLPDVHVHWSDVWSGAVITATLFAVGKVLIGIYLGRSAVGSNYGAAGSLVVLTLWIYYSAQILFFGAEWAHLYALRFGSHRNGLTTDRRRPGKPDRRASLPAASRPEILHSQYQTRR